MLLTTSDSAQSDLYQHLDARIDEARAHLTAIQQRWNSVANLRLIALLPPFALGFWWIRTGQWWYAMLAAIGAMLFAAVIIWHQRIGAIRRHDRALLNHRLAQRARARRDWTHIPASPPTDLPADHPYAHDLDLVGPASLLQLIDTTASSAGFSRLVDCLGRAPAPVVGQTRQSTALALVPAEDWREELTVAGMTWRLDTAPIDSTLAITDLGSRPVTLRHRAAAGMLLIDLAVIALVAAGVIPSAWLIGIVIVKALLSFSRALPPEHAGALGGLRQLRGMLPVAEAVPGNEPGVIALRGNLRTEHGPASQRLSRLDRALSLRVPRGSILWFPLQLAVNWDLLVEFLLIRVAGPIAPRLGEWIDTVAELETTAAFANLSALNPGWTWPAIDPPAERVEITAAGHPLIPVETRVPNDIAVGPAGTVVIVTGSNMAGKSTLLRTIGLNAVLARAGGPVCATAMRLPVVAVWSSARIQDSLTSGVSLFMAELMRLRQVVDAARSEPTLYLLDEILHGTNTSERRIAARTVIRHLLATGALGIVSTHDLELLDPDLESRAQLIHLVDQIVDTPEGPEMRFDYQVKPGIAPSSNALRLLDLVGLGSDVATGDGPLPPDLRVTGSEQAVSTQEPAI